MSKKKENKEVEAVEEKLRGGALLKSVRQEKGVSLETVHDATKIPMDALRAIEEGYTVRTLTPFYMKGFLKIYAQYLDLEVSQVIEDHRSEQLPPYVKKDVHEFDVTEIINKKIPKKTKQKIFIIGAYVLCLFLIFKIITFFTHGNKDKAEAPVKNTVAEETVPDLIAEEEKKKQEKLAQQKREAQEQAKKDAETKRREEAAAAARKKAQEAIRAEAAVVPAVKPKPAETVDRIPVENNMENVTLTVRANKNSWLRVSADDQVVFQSTLRLGSVETWMAKDKIEISGKNINSLEFELNGKMIGSLGREDRKAKKLIVTKDGLTVTQ